MNVLISIIIPIYNVENYLNRCIESIVNQTYKNLEIILVDDGSPDNCPAICDEWAKKDSRIIVIHKENGGLSDARNAGMKAAKGDYISFIDSDDWVDNLFYETLIQGLDNGADISECATRLCDEDNNTIKIRGFTESKYIDSVEATQLLLKESGIYQTVWNKLYKKELLCNINFEYGKFHEDNFWTWQIFLKAKKIFVSSMPMYNYVQRKNSIMGNNYSIKRLDGLEADFICYNSLIKDDKYKSIVINRFIGNCLFQLQSILKFLKGEERKDSINIIISYLKKSNIKNYNQEITSFWNKIFIRFPKITALIRAITGIGF